MSQAATAQQEINKSKNKNVLKDVGLVGYHPWSSLTDGGLHDDCHYHSLPQIKLLFYYCDTSDFQLAGGSCVNDVHVIKPNACNNTSREQASCW